MKFEHTSAPWMSYLCGETGKVFVASKTAGVDICEVFDLDPTTPAPRVVNASLIASAPELLQHLKYMMLLAAGLHPSGSELKRSEALDLYEGTVKEAGEVLRKAQNLHADSERKS